MDQFSIYRKLPLTAMLAALAVVVPIFFHLLGLGSTFLPMFQPVVLGGFLLPLRLSLSVAVIAPFVSFIFTGMPPLYPPILPVMILEMAAMCCIANLFYVKKNQNVWFTLFLTILLDRLILLLIVLILAPLFGLPKFFSVVTLFHGVPGLSLIHI